MQPHSLAQSRGACRFFGRVRPGLRGAHGWPGCRHPGQRFCRFTDLVQPVAAGPKRLKHIPRVPQQSRTIPDQMIAA